MPVPSFLGKTRILDHPRNIKRARRLIGGCMRRIKLGRQRAQAVRAPSTKLGKGHGTLQILGAIRRADPKSRMKSLLQASVRKGFYSRLLRRWLRHRRLPIFNAPHPFHSSFKSQVSSFALPSSRLPPLVGTGGAGQPCVDGMCGARGVV